MNTTLLLIGGVAAYLAFGKKVPVAVKKVEKKIEEEIDTEQIGGGVTKKTYPSITGIRKDYIDKELLLQPLAFEVPYQIPAITDITNYQIWAMKEKNGLYQDWLTIMLYVQIALTEGKWDAETGEFPLFLDCGKKLEVVSLDPPLYGLVDFEETSEQCDERLHHARGLLADLNGYVKANLPTCPPGAICEVVKGINAVKGLKK